MFLSIKKWIKKEKNPAAVALMAVLVPTLPMVLKLLPKVVTVAPQLYPNHPNHKIIVPKDW